MALPAASPPFPVYLHFATVVTATTGIAVTPRCHDNEGDKERVSRALLFQPFFSNSCYLSRVPKKGVASILSRSVMALRGKRMCLRGPVVRTDVTVKATV